MEYAYVTFIMRNDNYVPGALVLAYSLKMITNEDLVCLITDEVSVQARQALEQLFTHVISIPAIMIKSRVTGGRQDRSSLLTRFQALRLGSCGDLGCRYQKIILLDADILPFSEYDCLFDISAPAGILLEGREKYLEEDAGGSLLKKTDADGKWLWHREYEPVCAHSRKIPSYITDRVSTDYANMGINAGLWRLDPSMTEYQDFLSYIENPEIQNLVTNHFPWPEMQLGTLMWSGRWHNIDIRFCSIGGYPDVYKLYGTHFAGIKPWQIRHRSIRHYAGYEDFRIWYRYFSGMYLSSLYFQQIPSLRKIWEFIKTIHG